jgi:hypothetical protein
MASRIDISGFEMPCSFAPLVVASIYSRGWAHIVVITEARKFVPALDKENVDRQYWNTEHKGSVLLINSILRGNQSGLRCGHPPAVGKI